MKTKMPSFLITLLIASLGVSQNGHAVTPAPDGDYPGGNTAEGQDALLSNNVRSGTYNTAIGWLTLNSNTSGSYNTAVGADALQLNHDAGENTAIGAGVLPVNDNLGLSGGNRNTAVGAFALFQNTTGKFNTAIGNRTLFNNTIGSSNIVLGANAGSGVTSANNVICIGAAGSNAGNSCFIGQIFGSTSPGGTPVFINSNGRLGTATSSLRFKQDIKPMERTSEVLFALKPVTFRYKKENDPEGIRQFGLIAEDVEEVNPALVVRDQNGKAYSVRYEQINAMLLNEFLKEHRKVQKLEAALEQINKHLKAQDAKIEKVTERVQARNSAPQIVAND
jgi:hypothetical protein